MCYFVDILNFHIDDCMSKMISKIFLINSGDLLTHEEANDQFLFSESNYLLMVVIELMR